MVVHLAHTGGMARQTWLVRCTARRTNGLPCRHWAILGAFVCRNHGGSAPQVRAAAERRWMFELRNRAIEREAVKPLGRPLTPPGARRHLRPGGRHRHLAAAQRTDEQPWADQAAEDDAQAGGLVSKWDGRAVNQPDRVAVLGALAAMDRELGLIGSYIDREGHEREAILLEDAERSLLAARACLIGIYTA